MQHESDQVRRFVTDCRAGHYIRRQRAAGGGGPERGCANIKWSAAFLKDCPTAPAACREVIVKDGVKFAAFNGKVSKVGQEFVQVEVSDDANNPISTIAFQIGVGGKVTMNNKVEGVRDLKVGDLLTFWVREGQFGFSPTLTNQPMTVIKPEAMPTT
jgi:hypothetical protein